MKVEYVSPFAEASMNVIGSILGVNLERGALGAKPEIFTTQQINIVCGITGDVEGLVIYGMSMTTADRIASQIIGSTVVTFDQAAASAIAELGTLISGQALTLLMTQGYRCDITPPTIIRGTNVRISTLDIPALTIGVKIPELGIVDINVSIQERHRAAA